MAKKKKRGAVAAAKAAQKSGEGAKAATRTGKGRGAAAATASARRIDVRLKIPEEAMKKARRAVYYTPGATLQKFLVEAIDRYADELERQRGEPFPKEDVDLPRGRRVILD